MHAIDFGCSPANQGISRDVTTKPLAITNGKFDLPEGPGLGIDVDILDG